MSSAGVAVACLDDGGQRSETAGPPLRKMSVLAYHCLAGPRHQSARLSPRYPRWRCRVRGVQTRQVRRPSS